MLLLPLLLLLLVAVLAGDGAMPVLGLGAFVADEGGL